MFKYFLKALPLSKKAVDSLGGRAIDYKEHEAGYCSGNWHHRLSEKNFLKSCKQYELLKGRPAGGYSVWTKDCIIFPLKNTDNKIVSLYGRSITGDDDNWHFYLSNRSGLYPSYPSLQTKKLILCEIIIDAASLLQQEAIKSEYTILALYGTNGLTEEHQKAIIELPQLDEIILMQDADEAGGAATAKHTVTLKQLLPEVSTSKVMLPEGEDINSVLQNHDAPEILSDLIAQQIDFSFSIEHKKE